MGSQINTWLEDVLWIFYAMIYLIIDCGGMRSIKVTLERDEELTADFLDIFSKLIINSTDYIFNLHFENKS
jgi:hypothetical protein